MRWRRAFWLAGVTGWMALASCAEPSRLGVLAGYDGPARYEQDGPGMRWEAIPGEAYMARHPWPREEVGQPRLSWE